MRTTVIALVVAVAGCEAETVTAPEPPAVVEADAEVAAVVAETLRLDEPTNTSATESASESETIEKPKKRPLNYNRCMKINRQFIGCGWRCVHRGGSVDGCVNACGHFLSKRGYKCLHIHGVPFG